MPRHLPRKMELIEGSETSAFKPQTPGKYPKENILHKEHGESLKSRQRITNFQAKTKIYLPISMTEHAKRYRFSPFIMLVVRLSYGTMQATGLLVGPDHGNFPGIDYVCPAIRPGQVISITHRCPYPHILSFYIVFWTFSKKRLNIDEKGGSYFIFNDPPIAETAPYASQTLDLSPSKSNVLIKMGVEQWQNDKDRGKPKYLVKSLSQCQIAHHKSQLHILGSNLGLRGERR